MRILFAEDTRPLSEAVTAMLIHNGYSVDPVYDGEEAIDYFNNAEYDCAILDIMMPKKDGIEVLREIRKKDKRLPVILLTAKSEIDDRVTGLDAGADDYIPKPFAAKELLARVRSATRRRDIPVADDLTFSDLSLDPSTFTLCSEGGETRLTAKEFSMMEMFLTSPGTLIPAELFMEKIWDADTEVSVVWVFISNLRKKLRNVGSRCVIKAARGVGYSLEEGGK